MPQPRLPSPSHLLPLLPTPEPQGKARGKREFTEQGGEAGEANLGGKGNIQPGT